MPVYLIYDLLDYFIMHCYGITWCMHVCLWIYVKSLCIGVSVLRVRVYHEPKPEWVIISVELLWSLGSGIN